MADRQAFTQRETETLFELISAILRHRSEYSRSMNRIKHILELRSLSERCCTFLITAHHKGVSFADLSSVTAASELAGHLNDFFIQAFMIEGSKFHELLSVYAHNVTNPSFIRLFDNYRGEVMRANNFLSEEQLDQYMERQGAQNFPTRLQGYQPNHLIAEGTPEALDLSGVLFHDEVTDQVGSAFTQLCSGELQEQEAIELFSRLKTLYPSQTKAIAERITENLYALPVAEAPKIREYAFNTVVPSLHECSIRTEQVLRRVFEEPEDKVKNSLRDLFESLVMNKSYLQRCAALDIAEHIQEQLDEEERDTNDYFIGGNGKAALYAEFFDGLRRHGLDMDFMLIRGMSKMTTGSTYELIDRGPKAVITFAVKDLCKNHKKPDTSVAKFFGSAWVLTYSKTLVQEIIANSDAAKAAMYTISGDQDYLHDIKKPGLMEDVLIRDLGV